MEALRIGIGEQEAHRAAAADREFFLALTQSTDACKNKEPVCAGGKYDPTPSPRFTENPPRYHAVNNCAPQSRRRAGGRRVAWPLPAQRGCPSLAACSAAAFRRIVQTPGGISIFYNVNQGQGWQRNIIMNEIPHLPPSISQWFGYSRGQLGR